MTIRIIMSRAQRIPTPFADLDPTAPEWTVPEGWQETPPTQMLISRFEVNADDGQVEITVSAFPGDVGGTVANVNRWRTDWFATPV
jgi:hypothetical protein